MSSLGPRDDIENDNSIATKYSHLLSSNLKIENRLHLLCKSSIMNAKLLQNILTTQPYFVSQQDNYGRLPLHILANNKTLFNGRQKRQFLSFVLDLLKVFPNAIQILDDRERIPFTAAIHNWIEDYNETSKNLSAREMFLKSITHLWSKNVTIPSTLVTLLRIIR